MRPEVDYGLSDVQMILMLANCSNEPVPRSLTVGVIDYYVQHYIFPVQFILGVVGNSINLLVLMSAGMKNQANTLLSAMAFADLGFLFCMLPHSLVSFSFFYKSVRFSYFYFLTKTHAVALANMFSTAATFLVLAVSLERFSGVRRPMHTRFQLGDTRIIGFILSVFAFSFMLSFYHHVEYYVNITIGCSNVWATFQHISQLRSSSKLFVGYVWSAKYIQSIFGVALPVIIVAILNVSLIYILRRREILPRSVTDKAQNELRYSDTGALQRQERKVTATVIAIITCFTVTHLPTLGPFIWEQIYSYRGMKPTITFNNVITLLNMLLVSGKVLNFVLFCSSSVHFRRRTVTILSAHLCQERYRKKYNSMVMSAPQAGLSLTMPHGNLIISNSNGGEMGGCVSTPMNAACTTGTNCSLDCDDIGDNVSYGSTQHSHCSGKYCINQQSPPFYQQIFGNHGSSAVGNGSCNGSHYNLTNSTNGSGCNGYYGHNKNERKKGSITAAFFKKQPSSTGAQLPSPPHLPSPPRLRSPHLHSSRTVLHPSQPAQQMYLPQCRFRRYEINNNNSNNSSSATLKAMAPMPTALPLIALSANQMFLD